MPSSNVSESCCSNACTAAAGDAGPARRERRPRAPALGPRQDSSRMLVHDDGEIAPRVAHFEIRDIADPHLIRRRDRGRPEPIGMAGVLVMDIPLGSISTDRLCPQARGPHEPGDTPAADHPSGGDERVPQPRAAVPCVMDGKEPRDGLQEHAVLRRIGIRIAPTPGVIPAAGHAIPPAKGRDAEPRPRRIDDGERVAFRAEQNRMAFFRSSCSSCRSACAFSSACRAAISRAGPGGGAFVARPRIRPSRTSFRHLDSMKGWISRAAATVLTCIPGWWLKRTAVSLNSSLYRRTARGRALGIE